MGCTSAKELNPQSRFDLALWYQLQQEYDLAEKHFEDLLEDVKRQFGNHHPMALDCLGHMAEIKMARQDYKSAETYLADALEGKALTVGKAHQETLHYLDIMVECMELQERPLMDIMNYLATFGQEKRYHKDSRGSLKRSKTQRNQPSLLPENVPIVSIGYTRTMLPLDYIDQHHEESKFST